MAAVERGFAVLVPPMAAAALAALKLLTQFGNLEKKMLTLMLLERTHRSGSSVNAQGKTKRKWDADLLELVGAPTGGRAFVRAPPPLICPGPGGLRRMHTPCFSSYSNILDYYF